MGQNSLQISSGLYVKPVLLRNNDKSRNYGTNEHLICEELNDISSCKVAILIICLLVYKYVFPSRTHNKENQIDKHHNY
jgi:hypothetical protein